MGYTLSLIVSANNTYESSLKLPVNKVGQEKATGQVLTVPIKTKLVLVCPFNPLDVLILSIFSPKVSPWMFRIWGLEGMMSNKPVNSQVLMKKIILETHYFMGPVSTKWANSVEGQVPRI